MGRVYRGRILTFHGHGTNVQNTLKKKVGRSPGFINHNTFSLKKNCLIFGSKFSYTKMSKFIKNISILQYLGNHIPFKPKLNTCTKVTNSTSKNTTPKPKKCNKKKKKESVQPPMSKASMWRNIFLFGLLPALLGLSAFVLTTLDEHERQPFVPYEYLRLRRHRFPWGEGNKSLFHNPIVNALPEGYEDELERKEQEKQLKEAQKK